MFPNNEILDKLDRLELEYERKLANEKDADWKAYYGGLIDGIRKARGIVDGIYFDGVVRSS